MQRGLTMRCSIHSKFDASLGQKQIFGNSFIDKLMPCGVERKTFDINFFSDPVQRIPQTNSEEVVKVHKQILFLSVNKIYMTSWKMKPKSYRDHLHKAISVETRMKLIINIIFVTLTTNTYLNFET